MQEPKNEEPKSEEPKSEESKSEEPPSVPEDNVDDDAPIENNAFVSVKIERRSTAKSLPRLINSIDKFSDINLPIAGSKDEVVRKLLNVDNINPNIKSLKYVAFGPMEARAAELEEILDDEDDYEFDQVLRGNNDDAHAFGQQPLSFLRKILATVCYPRLLMENTFPDDVKERARHVLKGCKGNSIGSVTDPAGIETIRRHVAKYIEKRDTVHSKWQDVILTAGAGEAMKGILKLLACNINGKRAGVMMPMPSKLLHRVYVQKLNMQQIGYYLDEESEWGIDVNELNRAYNEAVSHCNPRAIIVINPGNPTGNVLTRENIEDIVKFAYDKQLLICADEMQQLDIFIDDIEFVSFKKVLKELGFPYSKMEMASFMSASAGYIGEGGLRGGFVEFINVAPDVKELYLKYISTKVCPPVLGQVAIEALVNPPLPEEPSYDEYIIEKNNILQLHKIQATMVTIAFNSFTNFSCSTIMAGRHAFPRFEMPQTALMAAADVNQVPDLFFTSQLLEQKGICLSPGSEFGQKENTYHLSIALVLPPDDLNLMLGRFKQFNLLFNEHYACKCKRKKSLQL